MATGKFRHSLVETLEPRLLLDGILLANFGSSAGNNVFGTDWQTVYQGPYTSYSDAGPDGIAGSSTGIYHCAGISGAAARTFSAGDQVVVTWYNNAAVSRTFTPRISFDDLDYEGSGDAGTWYTLSQMTIPAGQSMTAVFTFDGTTAGSYYNVNTARGTSNVSDTLIDKIEHVVVAPQQVLAVDFGDNAGNNQFGIDGWNTVYLGNYTSYSADGPDGIIGSHTANYHCMGVSGPAMAIEAGDVIEVTWYNRGTSATTFTPYITFTDPDMKDINSPGTWYAMTEVTIPAGESAVTSYTVTTGSAGNYGIIKASRGLNGATNLLCDKIELTGATQQQEITVTIEATDASAGEPSNTGTFTVSRAGGTSGALAVSYSIAGTATNGSDYSSLSGTVTIPDGQASATITVTPVNDSTPESTESVILTVTSGSGYTVGSPASATVNIADDDLTYGITDVSGIINHRQEITINGAGFGTGPQAVVFDDFEDGQDGRPIMVGEDSAVVGQWNSINGKIVYQDDYSISGTQGFVADMGNSNANKVVRNFAPGTDEVFASWWVRIPEVIPGELSQDGLNWKHVWILGSDTVNDDILIVFLGENAQVVVGGNCGPTHTWTGWSLGDEFDRGDWIRMTFYVKGGLTDGTYTLTMMNADNGEVDTFVMASGKTWGGDATLQYETINFNGYGRQTTGSYPRFDDCYSATGPGARARVEIGNASTYANCTDFAICGVNDWSSTSIDATLNFGSLDMSGPLYMYVIDANGTVSPGYQLTIPQAPTAYDDNYATTTGTGLSVSSPGVIGNDIDLQGQNMTASKLTDPAHGSVTLNSNGSFTYTPTAGYYGMDSFTYRVSDGSNNSNTATVNIQVRQKVVDFGDAAPSNTFGTPWNTVFKGTYVSYSAAGPDGLLGGSTGASAYMGVSGSARTFYAGETVYVTWYNNSTSDITFRPVISFDDPDAYGSGTAGTWYNMNTITIQPGTTATTKYKLASGGIFSRINVCRNISNQANLLCDMIQIV